MAEEQVEPPLLYDWRQGDFVLGEIDLPIMAIDGEESFFGGTTASGAAVISQSCDIVRDYENRPWVQIAALVAATEDEMAAVRKRSKPRYGYLPSLDGHGLVVDFDCVATADKHLIRAWHRLDGCATDEEQRDFASALARHKQRFAFPDEFQIAASPLRTWIQRRTKKDNPAGRMIRSIEQIRVICNDWAEPSAGVDFVCLLIGDPDRSEWVAPLAEMHQSFAADYAQATMRLATWDELTAAEYIRSDRLDLDGLSDA